MRDGLLSIGEVSRLKGVGVKALRHYERIGLLRPCSVDPDTGYRRYSHAQLSDVDAIALCVKVGIPLKELSRYRLETGGFDTPRLFDEALPLARERAREALVALRMIEGGIAYANDRHAASESRMFAIARTRGLVCGTRVNERAYMRALTDLMERVTASELVPAPAQGLLVGTDGETSVVMEVWQMGSAPLGTGTPSKDREDVERDLEVHRAASRLEPRSLFLATTLESCFDKALSALRDGAHDAPALLLEVWGWKDDEGHVAIELLR